MNSRSGYGSASAAGMAGLSRYCTRPPPDSTRKRPAASSCSSASSACARESPSSLASCSISTLPRTRPYKYTRMLASLFCSSASSAKRGTLTKSSRSLLNSIFFLPLDMPDRGRSRALGKHGGNAPIPLYQKYIHSPSSEGTPAPAEGDTRLIERRNLLFPLAALTVGLPGGACSHRLCGKGLG